MSTSNRALAALTLPVVAELPATWDELASLGQRCLWIGKVANFTFARVCQAMLDGPGSKTQQDVADALGCGHKTVSRAVSALKIAIESSGQSGDLEAAYDEAFTEQRRPERQVVLSEPAPLDLAEPVVDAELVPDDEPEPASEPQPALTQPREVSEGALREYVSTFARVITDIASVTPPESRRKLRTSLIREIERVLA